MSPTSHEESLYSRLDQSQPCALCLPAPHTQALLKEDELVGHGVWTMHPVTAPANLRSIIIRLGRLKVAHVVLAHLAFWELLSLNYCAALPSTSVESHFKVTSRPFETYCLCL